MKNTVRSADSLKSIYELNLSANVRVALRGISPADLVKKGREIGLVCEDDIKKFEKLPKWQQEIFLALDEKGYIRHDLPVKVIRAINLLRVLARLKDNPLAESKNYENFVMTDEQLMVIDNAIRNVLSLDEYEVICYRFGLIADEPLSYCDIIGIKGMARESIKMYELRALRRMRYRDKIAVLFRKYLDF